MARPRINELKTTMQITTKLRECIVKEKVGMESLEDVIWRWRGKGKGKPTPVSRNTDKI